MPKTKQPLKYYLFDQNNNQVAEYLTFDKETITNDIVKFLSNNKDGELSFEKELTPRLQKKYAGNDILSFYGNNPKSGVPSKIIQKGNKYLYYPLKEEITS